MRHLLTIAALVAFATPAFALGSFGVRVGTGTTSISDGPEGFDPDITPMAIGVGWRFDAMPLVAVEIDVLYMKHTLTIGDTEDDMTSIALPMIAAVEWPLAPTIALSVGAGIEPRFMNDAEGEEEDMVWFMPLTVGVSLDLVAVNLNVDLRYVRQITESFKGSDMRTNDLLLMGGLFF